LHSIPLETKLFITPPFTQLNTVSGVRIHQRFLNTKTRSVQADLGIEVILKLFSKKVWKLFEVASLKLNTKEISDNSKILLLQDEYLKTIINSVITFLQGKINIGFKFVRRFLPISICSVRRIGLGFWYYGYTRKAKHLATLFTLKIFQILLLNVSMLIWFRMRNVWDEVEFFWRVVWALAWANVHWYHSLLILKKNRNYSTYIIPDFGSSR
jgi:hypothetical protein